MVAQGSQFSLNDVEVVSATIDIEDVRSCRSASSRSFQGASQSAYPRVQVPMALSSGLEEETPATQAIEPRYHLPEEEIA